MVLSSVLAREKAPAPRKVKSEEGVLALRGVAAVNGLLEAVALARVGLVLERFARPGRPGISSSASFAIPAILL